MGCLSCQGTGPGAGSAAKEGACRLLEFVAVRGSSAPRIDRQAGLIAGVKILGAESRNNREYSPAALREALDRRLYEGKPVNVDHVEGQRRSYRDRIGRLQNVALKEDGIYGDLHVNAAHPMAEQLFWDAEHAPENVGLSHDARGKTAVRGGKVIVESIELVRSVDLVADPATTAGLFEGELRDKIDADARDAVIRKVNGTAMDLIQQAVWDEDGAYKTLAEKKARVLAVLADWETELESLSDTETDTEESMNLKDLTLTELRTERKDLLEAIETEARNPLAEKLAQAETKLAEAVQELSQLKRRDKLSGMLREAKIDEAGLPESLREALQAAPEDKLPKLIEDMAKLAKPTGQQPTSSGPTGQPERFEDRVRSWK